MEHDELPAGIEEQARSYDLSPHFYDSLGGGATCATWRDLEA